jgi:3-hydroxy-5-methyl-1-naphthoate 3-O-methyltransferase
MPKSSKDDTANRSALDEFVRGLRKTAALKAALELEIFTRIAEGQRSLPALLRASGLNERGARLLLDALANINLLDKSTFEYSLTPTAETFLVKGKPTYYGDVLLAQLAWEPRGQVARAVRNGRPAPSLVADGSARLPGADTAATWVEWQSALQEFAHVWDQLGVGGDTSAGVQALAFGAEAALRLLSLVQRDSRTKILAVDGPAALTLLRSAVEVLQVQTQVQFLEGDWLTVALPADAFDLALVDSITSYRSLEQNIGALHRAYETLTLGGRVVLRAPMADDNRSGPDLVPLMGLDVLIGSVDGDVYTVTEYRGMLEAAGFFEVKAVGEQPGILTARRIPPPAPASGAAPELNPPPESLP